MRCEHPYTIKNEIINCTIFFNSNIKKTTIITSPVIKTIFLTRMCHCFLHLTKWKWRLVIVTVHTFKIKNTVSHACVTENSRESRIAFCYACPSYVSSRWSDVWSQENLILQNCYGWWVQMNETPKYIFFIACSTGYFSIIKLGTWVQIIYAPLECTVVFNNPITKCISNISFKSVFRVSFL